MARASAIFRPAGQSVVAVDDGERAGVGLLASWVGDRVGLHGNNVVALRVDDVETAVTPSVCVCVRQAE